MNIDKIRGIFVEEAQEIIAKLENDIIDLERSPGDSTIINELFRGVHTLKGSARSFGFDNLGRFVHTLEDLLDHYRGSGLDVPKESIEICLHSIDVIKELLERETARDNSLPENYESALASIKALLTSETAEAQTPAVPENNLAEEFADNAPDEGAETETAFDVEAAASRLPGAEALYKISVTLPQEPLSGSYDRVIGTLSGIGIVRHSEWDLRDVPSLDTFDPERNYVPNVTLFLQSSASEDTLTKALSFLDKKNRSLTQLRGGSEKPSETAAKNVPAAKAASSQIKIDTEKLDTLFNYIGELVIAQNFLIENKALQTLENENITRALESLSKLTGRLQKHVMTLRMVPVQATFEKMKRIAHDAGKSLDKPVELLLEGVETEIDKTMIDALADPLMHMIRNAVDHGLETTDRRLSAGKSEQGTVRLKASHRGGSVVIEVSDDGVGIDKEAVRSRAVERGLLTDKKNIPGDEELFALLLQPGFSTSESVSELSGRGVGLDVVRTAIAKLHGSIKIHSLPGKGSTFTITLPLTLAIIDGMLVKNGGALFIIPTLSVLETFTTGSSTIHTVPGQGRFVDLRGKMVPIVNLGTLLKMAPAAAAEPNTNPPTYILVASDAEQYAIEVNEIINRQQVVIKPLGMPLDGIKGIAGGAILGSGEIALILDVEKLYRTDL